MIRVLGVFLCILSFGKPGALANPELAEASVRIREYLANYSQDYLKISASYQVDKNETDWIYCTVYDTELNKPIARNRFRRDSLGWGHFNMWAGLLLGTDKPNVEKAHLQALIEAWYWDYRVIENQNLQESLRFKFGELSDAIVHSDTPKAVPYWKFKLRALSKGRKNVWGQLVQNPKSVRDFSGDIPDSAESVCMLYEYMHLAASPVLSIHESRKYLDYFMGVPVADQPTGVFPMKALEFASLSNPASHSLWTERLKSIKGMLVRCNPIYVNAFLSLGICYEQILTGDPNTYRNALDLLSTDLQAVSTIETLIREMKKESFKKPAPKNQELNSDY